MLISEVLWHHALPELRATPNRVWEGEDWETVRHHALPYPRTTHNKEWETVRYHALSYPRTTHCVVM